MKLVPLGLALCLAACASPRGPAVVCLGALGASGSYAFVDVGEGAEREKVEAAVESGLRAAGFTRADGSPDYLVEVLVGERPASVGAYEKLADTETPDWRLAPGKTSWWRAKPPTLGDVTVRLIDARTGVETYRATASGRSGAEKNAVAAARFEGLAKAALTPCPVA